MSIVAAVQMASGPGVGANLHEVDKLIARAADDGAKLVVLPENFAIMGVTEQDKVKVAEHPGAGPIQEFLARRAAAHRVWIVGGTLPLVSDDPDRVYAATLLFDDQGRQVARYDKMHLFDVKLEERDENYCESLTIQPGERVVVVDSPIGRLGLAVCYDLRFPELFRCMLDQKAEVIAVPAAFTAFTGRAHWEALVRVRAFENLCYLIASAQGGYHYNGRETYGDSMIVDPWGAILDRLPSGSGIVSASIDRNHLARIRRNFPAVSHRRIYCGAARDRG